MKKLLCLLLALIFTLVLSTMAFAAGEDIADENNPAGSPENVQDAMYGDDEFEAPTPTPTPEGEEEEMTIEDDDTPASGELVQTGGVPAFIFYIAGGVCILAALVLATRKSKESNAD